MAPLAIVREESFHCYFIGREQRAIGEKETKAQDSLFRSCILRREGGNDFFETRIIAERVPEEQQL
jgi:hypothetical protein